MRGRRWSVSRVVIENSQRVSIDKSRVSFRFWKPQNKITPEQIFLLKNPRIFKKYPRIEPKSRKTLEQENPRTDFFPEKTQNFFFWFWGFPRTMIHWCDPCTDAKFCASPGELIQYTKNKHFFACIHLQQNQLPLVDSSNYFYSLFQEILFYYRAH